MIQLLMNEYGRYRSLDSASYYLGYEPPNYRKNEITLTGDSFDRWFELLSDAPVDCAGCDPITLAQNDPQVRLLLAEEGGGARLTVQTPCPYRFFGSYRSLYALGGGELLRCSGEFREKIYPLLEAKQQTMYLARKDLPTFCGCVLKKKAPLCCSSGVIFSSRDSSLFYRTRMRSMIFLPGPSTPSAAGARSISVTA